MTEIQGEAEVPELISIDFQALAARVHVGAGGRPKCPIWFRLRSIYSCARGRPLARSGSRQVQASASGVLVDGTLCSHLHIKITGISLLSTCGWNSMEPSSHKKIAGFSLLSTSGWNSMQPSSHKKYIHSARSPSFSFPSPFHRYLGVFNPGACISMEI